MPPTNCMTYKTSKSVGLATTTMFTAVFTAEGFLCWQNVPVEADIPHGYERLAIPPHIPVTGLNAPVEISALITVTMPMQYDI